MAKRKNKKIKKNKKKLNILTFVAWLLAFVALALGAIIVSDYMSYDVAKENVRTIKYNAEQSKLKILKKDDRINVNSRLKEILKKNNLYNEKEVVSTIKSSEKKVIISQESININEKKVAVEKKDIGASHEYESLPEAPKRKFARISTKPRLAIIIDDVGVKSQVKAIKGLNLVLTMSFLPPSKNRPNSSALAAKEKFYMVHLPMEAMSYTKEEPFTLRTSDNQDKILTRISKIKKLFPRVHYINNHTGSKFTADERSVNRLINILNQLDINFIDSRTTAQTKVPKVMKNYGLKYVARDVFLDHKMDKAYVKKQIKEAIRAAKKHGTAIAIGHPHKNTLLALKESKHLLKEVELVLVNGLY